jgi:hypothetical protein
MKEGTVTPEVFVRATVPILDGLKHICAHCERLMVPEGAFGFEEFKARARASLQRDEIVDELRRVREDAKKAYTDLLASESYVASYFSSA